MEQLHKRFTDEQVKELLKRYVSKEIEREYIQQILGVKRRRFFCLVKQYTDNPVSFSIKYSRAGHTRSIEPAIEKNILKELAIDKKLIEDKNVPLKYYNYSYIQPRLEDDYKQIVSLPTIIVRAKKYHFYDPQPKRKTHDRMALTNHVGELIQHDSSVHKWSPYVKEMVSYHDDR